MISVGFYIWKLEMLNKYMGIRICESICMKRWWDIYNETGVLMNRVEWLPEFDDWLGEIVANHIAQFK